MRHSEYIIITISFSFCCSCVTYNDHCTLELTFRYYYCHWHCLLAWTKPTPPPTLTTTQPSLILIPFGTELNSTTSRSTMNDATTTTSELSSSYHPRNKFLSPPVELSWATRFTVSVHTMVARGFIGDVRSRWGIAPSSSRAQLHSSVQPALDGVVGGGGQATGWPGTITLHLSNVVRWH